MTVIAQQILTDNTKDSSNNPHLLSSNVNDVFVDSDYIYVATDKGVSVLDKSNRDRVGYHQTSNKVTSVWASSNNLYYVTWGSGLYRVSISNISGDFATSATQFLHTGSTPSLPTDYLYKVRGYSDSAILIGHSKGVSFYNGSSVYDGYHLLADDFVDNNVGDDPAGWTVTEGSGVDVKVDTDPFESSEKCCYFESTGSNNTSIEKTFTSKSKVVIICEVINSHADNVFQIDVYGGSNRAVALAFADNAKVRAWYSGGWHGIANDGCIYEAWRPHKLVIVVDCSSATYSVRMDGVLYQGDVPFDDSTVASVDKVKFECRNTKIKNSIEH